MDVLQSFYSNFISFFGTNLLTQCPSASCYFLLVFHIAETQYQTESKHRETFCGFFMDQKEPNGLELHLGGAPRGAQPTRAPGRPGTPRWVVPTSVASRTPSSPYKFTNIPKPFGVALDQKFRRRKASVSTRSNVDPVPASCRRGGSSPVAIFIIPAAITMRRE